ncbi:MAG: hypothetical protein UT74_C0004G0006 [Parcubacteria group bacterium GW2011_GWC1_40_11]|nr:MAG: hypothetical protein UT74_C0004G0006 [Parcubacteria group bacterium GW2011_GWC1_40_11]KKR74846.1 MAG: hypothetical protein UU17_C0005G0006 [Candidatus Nomurabacteria bacterium GW2011_GWA1_40_8]
MVFSNFVAANFFKKVSRSPRGFLLRPLLRAGESVTPPPLPQKNSGGAHHFRFRFLDLCIIFGKIISKVCEGFNSGEGKYINLPENQMSEIKLQGTDIGTFTYESEKVLPDGTSTVSSFVDIPVTTQTQAEVTLNTTTQIPELKLDVTGDGIMDFTLAPNATFDPVTYLQIMKATINSLDIPQAKIKAFNNRVDNIIKSIQKGKISKAELKAEKFKKVLEKKLAKPDPKKPKPKKLSKTDAQLLLDMLNKLLDNIS